MKQSPNKQKISALFFLQWLTIIIGTIAIVMYFGKPNLSPLQTTKNMKQIKIVQATSATELEDSVNNAIKELYKKDINKVENINFFHSSRTTSNSYPASTLTTYTCVITYTE